VYCGDGTVTVMELIFCDEGLCTGMKELWC
jgi:hypothetical protein